MGTRRGGVRHLGGLNASKASASGSHGDPESVQQVFGVIGDESDMVVSVEG